MQVTRLDTPATAAALGLSQRDAAPVARRRRRRGWLLRRALVGADVVGLALAFLVSEGVIALQGRYQIDMSVETVFFVVSVPLFIAFAKVYGLYDRDEERTAHSTVDDLVGVFHLCTVGMWLLWAFARVSAGLHPPAQKLVLFWLTAIVFVSASRSVARAICRRSPWYVQNTLVVGAGQVGQLVARKLRQHSEYGVRLLGFVDADPLDRRAEVDDLEVLGGFEQLPEIVAEHGADRVVVAFSRESEERVVEVVRQLSALDVQIDIVPRLYELVGPSAEIHNVEALPLVGLSPSRPSRSSQLLKRTLDLALASLTLALVAPLFVFIALRIKLDSRGPVLFKQERVGLNMQPFTVLKFRTMRTDVDQSAHRDFIRRTMAGGHAAGDNGIYKLSRPDAVTRFGSWLRRTSLDELPQLVNVLRGDMSLVGPRPCIPYEVEGFAARHFDRFLVRPGLTGLWQVSARAHATFGEALDMDVAYVRSWSLGLDLWLLGRTPIEVLRGRKATA